MNNTLSTLANAYLNQGTGAIMLYYSMEDETTGVVGSGGEFTGVVMNVSPSSTVGQHTGLVIGATGATEAEAGSKLESFFLNEKSGVDLTFSSIKFDGFANEGFMSPDDLETELSFLFSFEKIKRKNGVLFGNLVKDTFDDGGIDFISEVPEDNPHIAALVYQIKLMQDDIDELRRYIVSSELLVDAGGGSLPTADPRSAGKLWNNRGTITVS